VVMIVFQVKLDKFYDTADLGFSYNYLVRQSVHLRTDLHVQLIANFQLTSIYFVIYPHFICIAVIDFMLVSLYFLDRAIK